MKEYIRMEKSKKENDAMANSAQALMHESQKILQQVMAECSVEDFQAVPLNIPQVITGTSGVTELTDQEQVWQHINQLYDSQAGLYGEPVNEVTQVIKSDTKIGEANESLDEITKMLGM